MKLYDYASLQLFEAATIKKDYNIFLINDYNVYLYNRLNEDAASKNYGKLEKDRIMEEKNFRKSVENKFLCIRNWRLEDTFTFLECDDGFTMDDKVKFCRKIADELDCPDIKIKVKNFTLFKEYAKSTKNTEMLNFYDNYFQNYDD